MNLHFQFKKYQQNRKRNSICRLIIGRAKFIQDLPKRFKNKFQNGTGVTKKVATMKSHEWKLCWDNFIKNNWDQIFWFLEQSSCEKLELQYNHYPEILKSVSTVTYTQLQYLGLNNNRINNIEALTFINLRSLRQIYLVQNQIIEMKSFNKVRSPRLASLNFNRNFVQSLVNRYNFGPKADIFYFENTWDVNRQFSNQDASQIVKMQPKWMKKIMLHRLRIRQNKLKDTIKSKYQQIQIFQ